jgi:teichuronic acid biosynthesis glycosyltransferase TuaH
MATISSPRAASRDPTDRRIALAVADANWYTTENLFREVQRSHVSTLMLKCIDYYNAWMRRQPPWAWPRTLIHRGEALWQREFVLPSGWMKRFPTWGMRPIGRSILDWRKDHARDAELVLVMTYPHYLYLRDLVRPDRQVYFNIDDYAQYWPRAARRVNELERQAVREADLTVCVSRLRAEELRAAVPEARERIRHLPHGFPSTSLAEHPWERPAPPPVDIASLPRPLLGYVGSLEDRVDWALLTRLSEALPHASIVIVGRPVPLSRQRGAWYDGCRTCLARPNVHAIGWRPQEEIHHYNRAFDVCLIPYRTDHPFNRVCSPTKIMDYMGTGRPIVSTDVPECRLYDHLFHVAAEPAEFVDSVRAVLDAHSDDGRAAERFDWAHANTCRRVVDRLLSWLPA